jgi:hypothetical protein
VRSNECLKNEIAPLTVYWLYERAIYLQRMEGATPSDEYRLRGIRNAVHERWMASSLRNSASRGQQCWRQQMLQQVGVLFMWALNSRVWYELLLVLNLEINA